MPHTPKTSDIEEMRSGLSFGIGTFIMLQRFSFVNIAKKRKKNPMYQENERIR